MSKSPTRFARLYRIPIILALLTTAGLVSALVADGVWDAISWLFLAIPLAGAGYCLANRRPPRRG